MSVSFYKKAIPLYLTFLSFSIQLLSQDLSFGLNINDLEAHPMQEIAKPSYLETIIDPSFGTTIRRISDAGQNGVIVPMYSTIQAWNANESLMILYNVGNGHQLLDGMTYEFIRNLNDISPVDLEQIFWHTEDPNTFFYPESTTNDFISYDVNTQIKTSLFNLGDLVECNGDLVMGNDIQMMSLDNNIISFRCENEKVYTYNIENEQVIEFDIDDADYTAASVAPSGEHYYHNNKVYNANGEFTFNLNEANTEHSCIGSLTNGNDAHFAIAFEEGPNGGCIGDIIAHDLTTGVCFPIISQSQGYDYPKSGTHISSTAYKNTEGGWLAASMIGYDEDGQSLLDQELVIAKVEQGNIKVCRIAHHRSDENDFDYWGEPHPVISPSGTRVLFGSDWSGAQDGQSIDSYVVELPAFEMNVSTNEQQALKKNIVLSPNPVNSSLQITFKGLEDTGDLLLEVSDSIGRLILSKTLTSNQVNLESRMKSGIYFYRISEGFENVAVGSFVVE